MNRLLAAILVPCITPAYATAPCPPGSAYGDPGRSSAEWAAQVTWVAVGRIVEIKHDVQPYANCALEDRSACAQFNAARLTLKVEKMEKGATPAGGELRLAAHYCGREMPPDLDTTRRYRFFGNDDQFYVTFEPATR